MLKLLFALLVLPFCLAASKTPHERLVELAEASSDGVIRLNEETFDLLTAPKRDWSAVVQLTALGKNMKCTPCKEFDPAFHSVSKAWTTLPKSERGKHFFATADFADAEGVFRRLNIMSAPVVTFYPATQGPNKLASGKVEPFNYDFSNYGHDAKELANQLSPFTPVPIPFREPINWGLIITIMTTTVTVALTARLVYPVIFNRWTWAVITISTMLVMTSGFMFVRIRGMPFRTKDHTMVPGFQNMVGAEIWTVASKYFFLSSAFLALILAVPRQTNKTYQRPAVYLATLVIALTFSALIKDFKIKNGGYPFSYLF